ncbi:MAG: indole-3-glycerol phosphate synthase TrpC [Pseudomonadota bacterium]|nr:indole-3-glycerol phosphate synthase TrpC [Pseudomonadota bacterium]
MNNILDQICKDTRELVEIQRKRVTEKDLQIIIDNSDKPRTFKGKIDLNFKNKELSLIAEIKKASPSKGIISKNFDPASIARCYTRGNATCISVLTNTKYFHGSIDDLKIVKKNSTLPILRKDFIVSEYQVIESRAIGADCILLIHGALSNEKIKSYINLAHQLDMDVLIETHDYEELLFWLEKEDILIGINNRNLKNMNVSINHGVQQISKVEKNRNIICESGISSLEDLRYLIDNSFRTFLIGEFLMKSEKPDILINNILNCKIK